MCSISGSFSKDKIRELTDLNAYRGQFSHSICYYNVREGKIDFLQRKLGPLSVDQISFDKEHYCIVHQQAPTTETDNTNIHPAAVDGTYLWHNGIIKQSEIERLQEDLDYFSSWDTELLLRKVIRDDVPSNVNGSFACVMIKKQNLYVFRNEIAPLFMNFVTCDLSSTVFENGYTVPSNKMWILDPSIRIWNVLGHFETTENPYFMGD